MTFDETFEQKLTDFLYRTDIPLSSDNLELLWDSFILDKLDYNDDYCSRLFLNLIAQHFEVRNNLRIGLRNSVKRFGKIHTRASYTNLRNTTEGTIFGYTVDCVLEEL
tara:strand:- start:2821 stop:3144 length:324 start_codon:yes stop_codon:yes gene_type:complete